LKHTLKFGACETLARAQRSFKLWLVTGARSFAFLLLLALPSFAQVSPIEADILEDRLWGLAEIRNEPRDYVGFLAAFPESSQPAIQRLNDLGVVGALGPNFKDLLPHEKIELQRVLLRLGYDPGIADGIIGARTIAALEQFQADIEISISGPPNLRTLNILYAAELELEDERETEEYASIKPDLIEPSPVFEETGGDTRSIGANSGLFEGIRASRIFAGPTQYPPEDFAAYGVVAFKSRSVDGTSSPREQMICNAYLGILPEASELSVPITAQMVTVWPILSDEKARDVAELARGDACVEALAQYGLSAERAAISDAKRAGIDTSGAGPFLLAWSPADKKGDPNAPVLAVDMSNVETNERALKIFDAWANEIEKDSGLWVIGWQNESIRAKLQSLVAKYGPFFSISNVLK